MNADENEAAANADDASTISAGSDQSTAWLTIRRRSPEDIKERELYASLDGRRIAILRFGDEVTIAIPPGQHEVRVHNTLSRKKNAFDAAAGQHVCFKAVNVPGKGFALLAFFLGAALMWTGLEREADGAPPGAAQRTSPQ
jgi:hypothetical protein